MIDFKDGEVEGTREVPKGRSEVLGLYPYFYRLVSTKFIEIK